MKTNFIQSIGIIIVLIGVLVLALGGFDIVGSVNNNLQMGGGLLLIIIGLIAHIVANRRVQD